MNTWIRPRAASRASAAASISPSWQRASGDDRPPHRRLTHLRTPRNLPEAAGSRFDDVHAERVELAGQSQLGFRRHRIPGRLFAVAQRGIEDDDILSHGFLLRLSTLKKKDREPDWVRGAGATPC
jgi:hypothetical protein